MKAISKTKRNRVLLRVALLVFLPLFIMVFSVLFFRIGSDKCLFAPKHGGNAALYLLQRLYPVRTESPVFVQISYQGNTRVQVGDTVIWDKPVDLDGMYRKDGNSIPYLTPFWIPTQFSGLPFFQKQWIKKITGYSVIDISGFLGPPGNVYLIATKDDSGKYYMGNWEVSDGGDQALDIANALEANPLLNISRRYELELLQPRRTIYFLGSGNSFAGRASYDASTGLLLEAVSFTMNSQSMTITIANYPTGRLRIILLPFVLFIAVALAFYEMYWSSAQGADDSGDLPAHVDFAVFGYTSVLVDLYIDFYFYHMTGGAVMVGIHLFMVFFFLLRFGWWWAALPAMEIILFAIIWYFFEPAYNVFTYFPASLGAWFLALMIDGKVSPGAVPQAIEAFSKLDKFIRRSRKS